MSKTKLISPGIPNYTLKRNLKLNGKYLSNDGGDEGIRIDDDGKVGIAESSPASQLEVAGEGALRITNTDQDAAWGGWVIKQHTDAFLNISYPGSSDNVITANYSNGRVGIGTSSPAAQLDVRSTDTVIAEFHGNTTSFVQFYDSTTGINDYNDGLTVGTNGGHGYLHNREAKSLYLGTNNTTRLTILSDGKVGIGSTTPLEKLHVVSDDDDDVAILVQSFDNDTSSNYPSIKLVRARGTQSSPSLVAAGDYLGGITFSGFLGSTGGDVYTNYDTGAAILAKAGSTPSNADEDIPVDLEFWTSEDGSDANAQKMIITSDGKVGIGTLGSGAAGRLHVKSEIDNEDHFLLEVEKPSVGAAHFKFLRSRDAAGVNDDYVGKIEFSGFNNAGTPEEIEYGAIVSQIKDVTDGSEDGLLILRTKVNGAANDTVNITSGGVGIGTAAPGQALEVTGNIKISGSGNMQMTTDGSYFLFGVNSDVQLVHDHDRGLALKSSANDANGTRLIFTRERDSSGTMSGGTTLAGQDNDEIGELLFQGYNDNGTPQLTDFAKIVCSIEDASDGAEDGTIEFSTMVDGTLAERMRIDNTGYVGIGTAAPETELHIVGDLIVAGDTTKFVSANSNDPLVIIKNTTNDNQPSRLQFIKDKGAAGGDGDQIAYIDFIADNDAQEQINYARMRNYIYATDGDESCVFALEVAASNGTTSNLRNAFNAQGTETSDLVHVDIGYGTSSTTDIAGNLKIIGNGLSTDSGTLALTGNLTATGTLSCNVLTQSSASDGGPLSLFSSTHDGATGGLLYFVKNRGAAGQDDDNLGRIMFNGRNDAGTPEAIDFGLIECNISDASDGAEGGKLKFSVASHDGEMVTGLLIEDGDAEDEIDVTIGSGTSSMTTIAGDLDIDGDKITAPGHLEIETSTGDILLDASRHVTLDSGSGGIYAFRAAGTYTPSTANEIVPKHYLDANTYHFIKCGFYAGNATKTYLPIAASDDMRESTNPTGAPERFLFICPYNGSVEKVLARSEEACDSSVLGIHIASDGTEIPSATATQSVTVDMAADDTSYEFDFASAGTNTFTKGQVIMFSFDPTSTMNDITFTIVLKFDVST